MKSNKNQTGPMPKSVVLRQLIACAVALCIMGLGAWSLLGQNAPYHPDTYGGEVSRDAVPSLTSVSD